MKEEKRNYVVCIRADESSDLEIRKIYQVLADESAAERGHLRVIDESGEDYLYPKEYFAPVRLPDETAQALAGLPSPTDAR